jgi:hypothetical protein
MAHDHRTRSAACRCGETTIELAEEPIQSVICYCESCRTAARGFEQDFGAPRTVGADGGVGYCLYRKDRVKIAKGARHLREYRLKPQSPTRRVVASCCGSPMFLDFTPGHWVSMFRDRLPAPAPEPQMRIMTKDAPEGSAPSDAIPSYPSMPPPLMIRLLAAWASMGLRRPKVAW